MSKQPIGLAAILASAKPEPKKEMAAPKKSGGGKKSEPRPQSVHDYQSHGKLNGC